MIYVMLVGWPIVMVILAKTMPWPQALVISIFGGYLLLPEQGILFDPPLFPLIDKAFIPSLVAVALALAMRPSPQDMPVRRAGPASALPWLEVRPGWLPRSLVGIVGLICIMPALVATALTNGAPITFEQSDLSLRGLSLYDGFYEAMGMLPVVLPLLLGRKYLAHPDQHRLILWALAIAGLFYTLLALYEIRMSPQLNIQIYGFFPHSWMQHVRGGGFRPIVFLQHGLFVALFLCLSAIASFGLARADHHRRGLLLLGGAWTLMTLALSNSLTALLIALALCPVVLFFGARLQLAVAAAVGFLVLTYPALRLADQIPTERIVAVMEHISTERAASLNFRFENEEKILDRVREKPFLGWGGFGRNRTYDDAGRGIDIVDGMWIVAMSKAGWIGYIGMFGLLAAPLIMLWWNRRRYEVAASTAVLCVIIAGTMIDLLPNAGQTAITWLIIGALLGRLELGRIAEASATGIPEKYRGRYSHLKPANVRASGPAAASSYTRQTEKHIRTSGNRTA